MPAASSAEACASALGWGGCRPPGRWCLRGTGGWVGRCRPRRRVDRTRGMCVSAWWGTAVQNGGGRENCCPTDGRDRAGGREGWSSLVSIDIDAFAIYFPLLLPVFAAEAVRSCGAGGGWDFQRVGRSEVAGRWSGAFHTRSASTAWGEGPLRLQGQLRRLTQAQVCVRTCIAASGLACRPAYGFAWQSYGPHPPPLPSDSLPRGVGF